MKNETARREIESLDYYLQNHTSDYSEESHMAMMIAIKALEHEDVLDKIREEILDEAEYAYANFDQYKEDILYAEPDELPNDDFRYGMERAVEIINKYRK